ncbi:MAG: hypothetical protein UZ21_OP11001001153 [Microgenomates bacterium OLB22]|nr:MAG: hypothetical protein UZ21_OP11001001153 [Microgenomates bacterium OLB22]
MISFAKCVIDKKVITLESAGSTPVPQSIYTMQGEGIPPEFLKVLSGVLQDAKVSQKKCPYCHT